MSIEMVTAEIILATDISQPITDAVNVIATTLIAGPAKRKAMAGPRPAPVL